MATDFYMSADNDNHRIIRIRDDDNYECIIGCTGRKWIGT